MHASSGCKGRGDALLPYRKGETFMKVSQMVALGKIGFTEKPIPTPREDEALVRLEYVGICGSDLHYFTEGRIGDKVVEYPFTLGHEPAGTVVAVGEKVQGLAVGDRVALEPGRTCGHCEYCRSGRYNLCPDVVFFATPPVQGVFQEYVAHEAKLCFPLPENVSTLEGALIEPLAVGFQAAEQGGAVPGQRAAVTGAGCIGLVSMMALRARGLADVLVTDVLQNRRQKALELGASAVVDAGAPDAEARLLGPDGRGLDLGIETTGSAAAAGQLIRALRKGGTLVLVGYPAGGEMTLPVSLLLDKEISIQTVFRYRHQYPAAIEAVRDGKVDLKGLVTRVFALDDLQEALDASCRDKAALVKAVIKIS